MTKIFKKSHTSKRGKCTSVKIKLPSEIGIELVQGNELRNYEIFFSLFTLSLSTAVGFWANYLTAEKEASGPFFFSAIAFSALAVVCFGIGLFYRLKIYNGNIMKSALLNEFKDEV